jgi:hypothetical protein
VDFSNLKRFGILLGAVAVTGISAHANIVFDITYTAAVQADSHFASIQSAVNFVSAEYSALYSDNITLNFTINEGAVGLGTSLFSNNYFRGSYSTLRNALIADAKTSDDATATALANLPVAAPYAPGGSLDNSNDWFATSAEAKALGLITNQTLFDGTYTFDNTQTYTYDPNNRGSGGFDFIGVTEHEFSELMGRTQQSSSFGYDILDTMRFTAPGVRNVDLSGVSGVDFSFDNGNTNLAGYNAGAGDKQDLDGAVPTDPFNASTSDNQAHSLNAVDISMLDVIGYDRVTTATPEPSTFLLALPLLGFGLVKFRKRVQA